MKKQIILTLLLAGISLFWNGILFGQDRPPKKIPKPKPVTNLRSGAQDSTTQQQQKERLELPDVLIIGKNTEIRMPTKKIVSAGLTSIKFENPKQNRQGSTPSSYSSPEQTPKFQVSEKKHATGIDVRFGNYNSTKISVNHWQELEKAKINFDSNYDRSDGQYPNSQFERWRVGLLGEYQLSPQHFLSLSGNFAANNYGLWTEENHKRKWNQFIIKAGLRGNFTPKFGYQIQMGQDKTPTQNNIEIDPAIEDIVLNREKNRRFLGKLYIDSDGWYFSVTGNTLSNISQRYASGSLLDTLASKFIPSNTNSFSDINITATRQLGQKGSVTFGARYEFYKLETLDKKENRINPILNFNWNLSSKLQFFIYYQPGWRFVTHRELFELNPFFHSGSEYNPVENHKYSFDVGTEWKFSNNNLLSFTYQFRSVENLLIWGSSFDPASPTPTPENLFQINTIPKIHLSFLKVDLLLSDLKPFQIKSSIVLLNSGIDDFGDINHIPVLSQDIPYLEDISWPSELQYQFQPNWTASILTNYIGSRTFSFQNPGKAKSIWLLNGKLNFNTNGVNIYLMANNLLNQKYIIWQNYPETGSQFFLGVRANF